MFKFLLCIFFATPVFADKTEKFDRFEMNWTTGKLRTTGIATSAAADGASFRPAEKRAWQEGVDALTKSGLAELLKNNKITAEEVALIQKETVKRVSSVRTTYQGKETVKVVLELTVKDVHNDIKDKS